MSMSLGRRRFPAFEIAMLVAGLAFISPLALVLINSFKDLPQIIASPLALPRPVCWQNYRDIFTTVDLARPMCNSFLMAAAVIACLVILGPMAAYALERRRMPGRKALRAFFLSGLVIPFQVIMVPLLQEFRMIHIEFTYLSLLLVYVSCGLPLCIFIYSGFMSTIPRSLEEAAAIDGCGPFRTFWHVVYPLLMPCTITIVIFWGLWIWNDFMAAFVFMGQDRAQLAFVQLWSFLNDQYVKNWNTIFAGVVVLSAPVTILYLLMQRRFIKGLTAGAVKE
ncbi:MAG: carbohydrate ABC transporter permease [Candidatus Sumerlaeota bacterium]|nr:carbohydrate ABC transporter permease [Candidatus Sumerlaeota bacterium]